MVDGRNPHEPDAHCESCSLPPAGSAAPIDPGVLIDGRYRVERSVGSGAMGVVLLARDVHLGRRVAVKLLPASASERGRHAFELEARALASVRHDGVVGVHSFGVHGDSLFFAMEYVDGAPLGAILAEHASHATTVPLHRAIDILMRVSSGLSAVHAVGMLHRDVKPENVVIEAETGRPVLVDFGLATSRDGSEAPGFIVGTPAFMAPECIRGGAASVRSEVYSLGCTAYEIFTGRLPFEGTLEEVVASQLSATPAPLSSHLPWLAPFDRVVTRALSKDPAQRHGTVAALRADLEHAGREAFAQPEPLASSEITELLPEKQDSIRVLVVDDDPVFVRLAVRSAQIAFADVHVAVSRASTGTAAVQNARRRLPQLLLLDRNLPEMDGAEVLSRIRSLPGGESVGVIVISGALGDDDTRWRFSVLGVKHFVPKPVNFVQLVENVVQLGQRRGWIPLERSEQPTLDAP